MRTRILSITVLVLLLIANGVSAQQVRAPLGEYVVIAWNDLGMHCMNYDYEGFVVLPPYNTLWAQVVHRGNPPQLVSGGITVSYAFPYNTDSASKVNFWDYEDKLFGVNLEPNIGLTGRGLTGTFAWNGHAWEAAGIPLVPFDDANPEVEQAYQFADVTVAAEQGQTLDVTRIVAPVSTEIHCDLCHNGGDDKQTDPRAVWQAVLTKHDEENGTDLLSSTPVLCASCHGSNALGTPEVPGIPNLSLAVHKKHGEEDPGMDCYSCHPGTSTKCLRGAMFQAGETCVNCHGGLEQVARSIEEDDRRPWLDEPRCAECHPDHGENPGTLYRMSTGHGGMYCAACHNSPHAELPTVQERDGVQAVRLQGRPTYLTDCLVCHTAPPTAAGPHGLLFVPRRNEWTIY